MKRGEFLKKAGIRSAALAFFLSLVTLNLMLDGSSMALADTFTSFDFPDAILTTALGINPRGDIVGRYVDADGVSHGYRLSGGEFTSMAFPGAINTQAFGINPRGDIVGPYIDADSMTHGFLLRRRR